MSTEDLPDTFPRSLPRIQEGPTQFDEQVLDLLGMDRLKCEDLILRTAWRYTENEHDALDLTQSVWEKLLNYSFEERKGPGWVHRVVRNAFYSGKRKPVSRSEGVGASGDLSETLEFTDPATLVNIASTAPDDKRAILEAIDSIVAEHIAHQTDPERIQVIDLLFDLDRGRFRSRRNIEKLTGIDESKVQRIIGPIKAEVLTILTSLREELRALQSGLTDLANDPPEPDSARTA
jgi:hypothetical protein